MPSETYSGVMVQKLFQETPNLIAEAVTNAVVQGSTSIARSILSAQYNGYNQQLRKYMYNAKNNYIFGLPQDTTNNSILPEQEELIALATDIIVGIIGANVSGLSIKFDYPDPGYLGYEYLATHEDYTFIRRDNVYATPVVRGLMRKESTGEVGFFDPKQCSFVGSTLTIPIEPTRNYPNFSPILVIDKAPLVSTTPVYNVSYVAANREYNHYLGVWFYDPVDGTYPQLPEATIAESNLTYYPLVPIRINNEDVINGYTEEQIESVAKQLKILDIDLVEFTENLVNPDDTDAIKDVDYAWLGFGVDVTSTESITYKYLFLHYKLQAFAGVKSFAEVITDYGQGVYTAFGFNNSIRITDASLKQGIIWQRSGAIAMHIRSGSVNTYPKNWINFIDINGLASDPAPDYPTSGKDFTLDIVQNYPVDPTGHIKTSAALVVAGQLDENSYIEIVIINPAVNFTSPLNNDWVGSDLTTDNSNGGFFILLAEEVVNKLTLTDRNLLFYETLKLFVFATETIHLEWYEDPAFLSVLGDFLTVLSIALGLGEGWQEFLINLLIAAALPEVFEILIEELGIDEEVALIIAAAVAIYSGQVDEAATLFTLPTSEALMFAANAILTAVNNIVEDDFLELEAEIEQFEEELEAAEEELEAAQDLLGYPPELQLYSIIANQQRIDTNEGVGVFYNRTIHNTNPGVKSLDAIRDYVDRALKLPKPAVP